MNRQDKQKELKDYIKNNFNNTDEYLRSLNKVGVKEQLNLFGIDIQSSCDLNIEGLRKILHVALGVFYR